MNPQLQRPEPVYMQLVAHYRDVIVGGDLHDGDRLPTVREIAEQWKVAHTTAAKALRQLASEGLVATSNQGAVVTFSETNTFSPPGRLASARRGRLIYPHGTGKLVFAGLVDAPEDVAKAMGIEVGSPVIRRERVTMHKDEAVTWSVSWLAAEFAELVPELLELQAIPVGTVSLIRERTGRFPTIGKDHYRECAVRAGNLSDPQIAQHLQIEADAPVLLGENVWPDDQGVIEFGQYVVPEGIWVNVQ